MVGMRVDRRLAKNINPPQFTVFLVTVGFSILPSKPRVFITENGVSGVEDKQAPDFSTGLQTYTRILVNLEVACT